MTLEELAQARRRAAQLRQQLGEVPVHPADPYLSRRLPIIRPYSASHLSALRVRTSAPVASAATPTAAGTVNLTAAVRKASQKTAVKSLNRARLRWLLSCRLRTAIGSGNYYQFLTDWENVSAATGGTVNAQVDAAGDAYAYRFYRIQTGGLAGSEAYFTVTAPGNAVLGQLRHRPFMSFRGFTAKTNMIGYHAVATVNGSLPTWGNDDPGGKMIGWRMGGNKDGGKWTFIYSGGAATVKVDSGIAGTHLGYVEHWWSFDGSQFLMGIWDQTSDTYFEGSSSSNLPSTSDLYNNWFVMLLKNDGATFDFIGTAACECEQD